MGEVSYILGVKIYKDHFKKLVALSQKLYIKKILKQFNMQYCNPIDTTFTRGKSLSKVLKVKVCIG